MRTTLRWLVIALVPVFATVACSSSKPTAEGTGTATPSSTEYAPSIDPAQFSAIVDNQWFPLPVGRTLEYRGTRDGKSAHEVLTVTPRTRTIRGVRVRVVRDRLFVDGALAEDTTDYYAQRTDGSVWYFGEDTAELDSKGAVTSTEGTWLYGRDGAQPGVIMEAQPAVGKAIRQEYYPGHAEDFFKVLSLDAAANVPAGSYQHVLKTDEWTPLEPDVVAQKFYAPGIGIVHEVDVKGGDEELKLVKVR